ncbi:MAG: NUDIX hydrolase [bacterium]
MKTKQVLYRGKYLQLCRSEHWEWVERVNCSGVVMMVARTPQGKVLLVEQYRIPLGKAVIEFPAGLVGDRCGAGEELLEAARRELLEETGYEAERWTRLGEGPPSAGLSPETITIFLAEGLRKVGEGGGDDTEEIRVHEVPMEEIDAWLEQRRAEGLAIDPKVYAGLYFLRGQKAGV